MELELFMFNRRGAELLEMFRRRRRGDWRWFMDIIGPFECFHSIPLTGMFHAHMVSDTVRVCERFGTAEHRTLTGVPWIMPFQMSPHGRQFTKNRLAKGALVGPGWGWTAAACEHHTRDTRKNGFISVVCQMTRPRAGRRRAPRRNASVEGWMKPFLVPEVVVVAIWGSEASLHPTQRIFGTHRTRMHTHKREREREGRNQPKQTTNQQALKWLAINQSLKTFSTWCQERGNKSKMLS